MDVRAYAVCGRVHRVRTGTPAALCGSLVRGGAATNTAWLPQINSSLPAATAFPALLVLLEMEWAVLHIPDEIGKLSAARTSVVRLGDFLERDEVESLPADNVCTTDVAPAAGASTTTGDELALRLSNCTFAHRSEPPLPHAGAHPALGSRASG